MGAWNLCTVSYKWCYFGRFCHQPINLWQVLIQDDHPKTFSQFSSDRSGMTGLSNPWLMQVVFKALYCTRWKTLIPPCSRPAHELRGIFQSHRHVTIQCCITLKLLLGTRKSNMNSVLEVLLTQDLRCTEKQKMPNMRKTVQIVISERCENPWMWGWITSACEMVTSICVRAPQMKRHMLDFWRDKWKCVIQWNCDVT